MINMKKIITIVALSLLPVCVSAASLDDLQVKELAKFSTSKINYYNEGYLINLQYIGTSTQAAIGITQTAITAEAPLGTADTTFGTAGTISLATYSTIGTLCDYINTMASYRCTIVDGRRSDASNLMYDVTASASTDAKASGGYSVKIDTGGTVATDPYILRVGIVPNSGKSVILKKCIIQNDGTGNIKVYGKLKKYETLNDGITRNDSTQVYRQNTADDTVLTVDFTANGIGGIEFSKDAHVVISGGNSTTTQTSTSYIDCIWEEK